MSAIKALDSDLSVTNVDGGAVDFTSFAITEDAEAMLKELASQVFAWPRIAIVGQSTVIYGPSNIGKTLLTLNCVGRQLKSGELKAEVFYINADDNARGIVEKQRIAQEFGFSQLVPGRNGFEAKLLPRLMKQRAEQGTAKTCVVVVDTLKKFADLMSKRDSSAWGVVSREFVAAGGTVIALAHTNKHKDSDGKSIYAGTADVIQDADCAFVIDELESTTERKTVVFRNHKQRGDVATELAYTFVNEGDYRARFDSVTTVDDEARREREAEARFEQMVAKDADAIEAITAIIKAGKTKRKEIINEAYQIDGISRNRATKVLDRYTGTNPSRHRWTASQGEKNARIYRLTPPPCNFGSFGSFKNRPAEGGNFAPTEGED
jgi:RecA-family ATPase